MTDRTLADFSIPIRSGVTPVGKCCPDCLTAHRRRALNAQLKALARHRADAAQSLKEHQ